MGKTMMTIRKVTVYLEGGIIQNVDVPEDVEVEVIDYDTEGADTGMLQRDEAGNDCIITVWKPK